MDRKISFLVKIGFVACLSIVLSATQLFSQIFIEAEDYSNMNGVDTEDCSDVGGGINVGWIDDGDWLEYVIDIPISGTFYVNFRVAGEGDGEIQVEVDGNSASLIDISATGAWQKWETVTSETFFSMDKGEHTIRFVVNAGGFNLNWFKIFLKASEDLDKPTAPIINESSVGLHNAFLSWFSSTDTTSAVTGYHVLQDGELLKQSIDTFVNLTNLPANELLNLAVIATDLAGNISEQVTSTLHTDTLPWDLLWADEFDYEGKPNPDNWYYETGGGGWGNGEYQYYTDGANAEVTGGELIIEARKESFGGNDFTSTRLNSSQPNDFLYGRIEIKAKLPNTQGSWPAIWTLPTDWVYGGWPDCGEIDIMEHSILTGYGNVFGTVHTGAYNHIDGTQQSGGVTFSDVTDTYHTYAIEWYPDHMEWYYDEINVFSFENEYKTTQEWPYDIPHHLLLNVAIGGGLGGPVNYDGEWPQQMIVDYVRVYDFKLGENDTSAPEAPASLIVNATENRANLSWNMSKDNFAIKQYYIYLNDELVDSVSATKIKISNLISETSYTVGVQAVDFAGNKSEIATSTFVTEAVSVNSTLVNSLLYYPNPLRGNSLTVELSVELNDVGILIMSMDGKILLNKRVQNQSGKFEVSDISLTKGVYLLSVKTEKETITKTLVIQ